MKSMRVWIMCFAALAVIAWFGWTDPDGGAETLVRLQWLLWITVVAGPVYLLRRALMDQARSRDAYRKAMESSTGAGLVFLGLCIVTGLLFLAVGGRANASEIPVNAKQHLPTLMSEQFKHWPSMPMPSALAGQVDKETCKSSESPRCWSPKTELKTAREYGFGLGQLTVTSHFDNFAAAKKLDSSLRDWQWADRYDAARQLRTMVIMDRVAYFRLPNIDPTERLAMTLATYNGGAGGLSSDRRICGQVPGCDPNRWFGHVELHSLKQKTKVTGYGKSFFEINREYVRDIVYVRRLKYVGVMG